uniref:ACB domain-containing protein n=1 Tax=Alexandrium monilatum TaxID=311494 RepID=A0A7S4VRT3_9DINO|mmetsp:Transcript_41727/g.130096  ORF Transcript_41727/g.130096 Transcript_41727/m.130096 type:complete len:573 (-) Transcript_41727:74-1792(-)
MPKRSRRSQQHEHRPDDAPPDIPDWLQFVVDHQAQVLFLCDSVLVTGFAVYTLPAVIAPLTEDAFTVVSDFAWSNGSPSFVLMISIMLAFTCLSVLAGLRGIRVALKERGLRRFAAATCFLAIVFEALVWYTASEAAMARPPLFRIVNVICQDTTVWGCERPAEDALPHGVSRWLQGSEGQTGEARPPHRARGAASGREEAHLAGLRDPHLRSSLGLGAAGRRLTAADSAIRFEESMRDREESLGQSEFCRRIHRLCVEPPGFHFARSCVCSGQWTASEFHDAAVQQAPGHWRGSVGAYCDAWRLATRLREDREASEWCYVSPEVECSDGAVGAYSVGGRLFTRGDGPCTSAVESRSKMAQEAFQALRRPVKLCGILGVLVLTLPICAFLLRRMPSKATVWHERRVVHNTVSSNDTDDSDLDDVESTKGSHAKSGSLFQSGSSHARAGRYAHGGDVQMGYADYSRHSSDHSQASPSRAAPRQHRTKQEAELELRFEEAQQDARRLLSDGTPQDLVNRIYAYYSQAEKGDASGERPSVFHPRDRAKYDSWASCRGMSRTEAVEGYVRTVNLLE